MMASTYTGQFEPVQAMDAVLQEIQRVRTSLQEPLGRACRWPALALPAVATCAACSLPLPLPCRTVAGTGCCPCTWMQPMQVGARQLAGAAAEAERRRSTPPDGAPPARPPAHPAGLVAPLCKPDVVFDFRLPSVMSINVSGHK